MFGCAEDDRELQPSDHVCWIYNSDEEHREILTRFLQEGLERNERVLYLARRFTVENVTAYLRDAGIEVKDALRSGQLTVLDAETAYLGNDGFQPERLAASCRQGAMQAVVDGYRGLRAASETGWLAPEVVSPASLVEYELRVDEVVSSLPQIGLCGYDARQTDPNWLLALQAVHRRRLTSSSVPQSPFAITRADGVIAVHGEANQTCRKAFSLALAAAAASISSQQEMVLDLIGLQFGDLTGLQTVARLAEALDAEGRSLTLHVLPDVARRIISNPSAGFRQLAPGQHSPVGGGASLSCNRLDPGRKVEQRGYRLRNRLQQARSVRRRFKRRR